jgi:hypothetical protein
MTATSQQTAADPKAPAAAPDTKGTPRSGSLLTLLGLGFYGLGIFVALVAAGWWMFGGEGETAANTAAYQPKLPEPAAPPPAFAPALASAAAATGTESTSPLESLVARLPQAAATAQAAAAKGGVALPGSATGDKSDIPRHQRWEIQFPPGNTIDTYSRQMDYFKIELGVVGGSDEITYLVNLTDTQPAKRVGNAADEKRLYLVWERGAMREADEELARRSQVPIEGRIVAHFCPEAVEDQLAQLEAGFASQKGIAKVRKTLFGVQSNDFGGFRFYVIDQKADQGA